MTKLNHLRLYCWHLLLIRGFSATILLRSRKWFMGSCDLFISPANFADLSVFLSPVHWWKENGLKEFQLTSGAAWTYPIQYDDTCPVSSEQVRPVNRVQSRTVIQSSSRPLLVTPNAVERCPVHLKLHSSNLDSKWDYRVWRCIIFAIRLPGWFSSSQRT